eukprot:CAMPEP_0204890122 /NCGR_PEP_ID=MMETSP1349-20130617/24344_1 /ASSEMBLY_ACC=CAM_ASM_000710 /TAXON_ID=215587 /ORGANISM="Aplanochytrium stocchinoi, Strain GSBS06" /LENGTH=371 /DNA_ID=CAMNT_0052054651 /DNA_START=156 /DNA_END=1268 /DNA_ORIENTATION=-
MVEGNSISAAFTALWRGLSGDEFSAEIAAGLLSDKQIDVMQRARFAPPLRALVGARKQAVDNALLKCLRSGSITEYRLDSSNVSWDDGLLKRFLAGEKTAEENEDSDDPSLIPWQKRWKIINKVRAKNTKTCYKAEINEVVETEKLNADLFDSGNKMPIIVSLGAGFDTRCNCNCNCTSKGENQRIEFRANWLRVDRKCVQQRAELICRSHDCRSCVFLTGDVAAHSTFEKIKKLLLQQVHSHHHSKTQPEGNENGIDRQELNTATKNHIIWLAEGLLEYLQPNFASRMLNLITSAQRELSRRYGFRGSLIVPLLAQSIDAPMTEHYGACFGWKWSDVEQLRKSLKEFGWEIPVTVERNDYIWGEVLEASW